MYFPIKTLPAAFVEVPELPALESAANQDKNNLFSSLGVPQTALKILQM